MGSCCQVMGGVVPRRRLRYGERIAGRRTTTSTRSHQISAVLQLHGQETRCTKRGQRLISLKREMVSLGHRQGSGGWPSTHETLGCITWRQSRGIGPSMDADMDAETGTEVGSGSSAGGGRHRSETLEQKAALRTHIDVCAGLLWRPVGARARAWLRERGLGDETALRAHRVGFDPGPRVLARPSGFPSAEPMITVPMYGPGSTEPVSIVGVPLGTHTGEDPGGGWEWVSPSRAVARLTKVAWFAPLTDRRRDVIVTGSIDDALAATMLGHPAVALLGGSHIDPNTVEPLLAALHHAEQRHVLATITGGLGSTTNSDLLHALLNDPAQGATNNTTDPTSTPPDPGNTRPDTTDPDAIAGEAIAVTTIELGDTAESLRVWVQRRKR